VLLTSKQWRNPSRHSKEQAFLTLANAPSVMAKN
jgi:hypothetical protein